MAATWYRWAVYDSRSRVKRFCQNEEDCKSAVSGTQDTYGFLDTPVILASYADRNGQKRTMWLEQGEREDVWLEPEGRRLRTRIWNEVDLDAGEVTDESYIIVNDRLYGSWDWDYE